MSGSQTIGDLDPDSDPDLTELRPTADPTTRLDSDTGDLGGATEVADDPGSGATAEPGDVAG